MTTRILVGDVRQRLKEIPSASVHCCVTSPPYFGLRSYLPDGHTDKACELGLEPTLAEYITNMVDVFREVRRVLRDDGTLWLNIGSSYASAIIESDDYVIRDDLTDAERAYVYAELATHFEAQSKALSGVRSAHAPAKPALPVVLDGGSRSTSELRDEGV